MSSAATSSTSSLSVHAQLNDQAKTVLTPEALAFVSELAARFIERRDTLLQAREGKQARFDKGDVPDFREDTKHIRESDWKVAPIPEDLQDRRTEITGPVERKMIINALNSGAKVFMADFEDSLTPTWENTMQGHISLRDAVNKTITFESPEGKKYALNDKTAVLIVRPRGWHLNDKHVTYKGKAIPGALLDFGLYFWHNANTLIKNGSGPYFYLPKLECMEEAQLWADIFAFSEDTLNLSRGTIKATVLIEVITAVFEMDEIMHALKEHCVGLNCGRWDYIFSYIKKFAKHPDKVLPDRAQVTMTTHFLHSYSLLLIKQTHRRGCFAMGGMAAFIPIKSDAEKNEKAIAAVRADKEREAGDGHDGTWVAHPGLVQVAIDIFNKHMPGKNQLDRQRSDVHVTAADLVKVPEGTITEAGFRNNISVSVQYTAHWLSGTGCVPLYNLMEDAATAEISRAQLWQWVHHDSGKLNDGRNIDIALFETIIAEELDAIWKEVGEAQWNALPYKEAADIVKRLVENPEFIEFLTLPAYESLA